MTAEFSEVTARDTKVRRKEIGETTRIRIWAKAAGRCVLCATDLLDGADTFWHAIPVGQIAHIVGASSGETAPRGKSDLSATERSFEENLLLLCYRCHKRIDDTRYRDKYTVELLTQKKQLHERRVREVTDFAVLRPTSVVTMSADIRGTAAPVSLSQVAEALRLDGYTGMGNDTRTAHSPSSCPATRTTGGYGTHTGQRSTASRPAYQKLSQLVTSSPSVSSRSPRSPRWSTSDRNSTTRQTSSCSDAGVSTT